MNLLPLTSERGLAKWGVLLKFSTSARNCMCNRSVIRKSRNKPKSRFTSPGPRSALKPAVPNRAAVTGAKRSEEHTSELQSRLHLAYRLLRVTKNHHHQH